MVCRYVPFLNKVPSSIADPVGCAIVALGLIVLVALIYRTVAFVYRHFLRSKSLRKYGEGTGAWAIVTGCTDGIGLGFAEVLAKRGFNLVLVSRDPTKLKNTAERIQNDHRVQTRVVSINASNTSNNTFQTILSALTGLDVSILVNNVGVNTAVPTTLEGHSDEDIENIINVNCMFTTKLTRYMIPVLRRRQCSLVLNLASMAGIYPTPLMPVYSASKAFNDAMSRAVAEEVKEYGIDVFSVQPGYVVSPMSGFKRPSMQVCTPQRLAKDTLNQIGVSRAYSPYWFHDLMIGAIAYMPEKQVAAGSKDVMVKTRQKLLEKKKKQ